MAIWGNTVLTYFTMFRVPADSPRTVLSLSSPINTILPRLPCKERCCWRPQGRLELRQLRARTPRLELLPLLHSRWLLLGVFFFHHEARRLLVMYPWLSAPLLSHPITISFVDSTSLMSPQPHLWLGHPLLLRGLLQQLLS